MAEYFLLNVEKIEPLTCGYELRVPKQKDFAGLYLPKWSNEERKTGRRPGAEGGQGAMDV